MQVFIVAIVCWTGLRFDKFLNALLCTALVLMAWQSSDKFTMPFHNYFEMEKLTNNLCPMVGKF